MPPINDKENPNPIIHATQKRPHPSHSLAAPLLGSSAICRFHLGSPAYSSQYHDSHQGAKNIECKDIDGDFPNVIITPFLSGRSRYLAPRPTAEERSVALALSAAAYPSLVTESSSSVDADDPKVELLHQAGFALFHPQRIQQQCRAICFPSYACSRRTQQTTEKSSQERIRDKFDANEVFDIIRNIQDPEHPLTLEQLNVVRLELIQVVDLEEGEGMPAMEQNDVSGYNNEGWAPKKFSTVHVQFT